MARLPLAFALALAASLVGSFARAAELQVVFANTAEDQSSGAAAIAQLHVELARSQHSTPGPAELRIAFEAPLELPLPDERAAVLDATRRLAKVKALSLGASEAAEDELARAELALRQLAPSPDRLALLAELNRAAGSIHTARGNERRGLEAFRLARRLAPTAPLEPGATRLAAALYERAGQKVPGLASIEVATQPAGARIWIDGEQVGTSPAHLGGLSPGPHLLSATFPGHGARTERLVLADGATARLDLLLPRLQRYERIQSVRATLLASEVPSSLWLQAGDVLADAAESDLVVLVRQAGGGALEGIIYDRRAATLGPPTPLADPAILVAELPRAAAGGLRVIEPGTVPLAPAAPAGTQRRHPWYATRWGTAALIAGGVVAVGLVLVLTAD